MKRSQPKLQQFTCNYITGALVSVLISSLIVGYIFARKMLESTKESIAKISVLFAVLMILSIVINNAALGEDFTQWVHETYQEANPARARLPYTGFSTYAVFCLSTLPPKWQLSL